MKQVKSSLLYLRYWFWIIGILISLGILFRVIHLDQPVYWVDEVATSMRVSGYTQANVTQQLATGLHLSPADILHFQQINPDGSFLDLLSVLSKSPEHAPLYFILMRGWATLFGTSVIAMRSLSVLFSLLALPAIFRLCSQLFLSTKSSTTLTKQDKAIDPSMDYAGAFLDADRLYPSYDAPTPQPPNAPTNKGDRAIDPSMGYAVANPSYETNSPAPSLPHSPTLPLPHSPTPPLPWTATALLAISPFFISYAQEARPYSLWVLLLLVLHQRLWRSLQTNRLSTWLSYALALTLSLYTSLLTVLVMAGQGLAVLLIYPKRWRPYLFTTGMAMVAFLPWCWVIVTHWQTLQDNTSWMQEPMPLWALLGVWFYGLSVLFFDVPVAAGMPVVLVGQMLTSLVVMVGMIYAVHALMNDGRDGRDGNDIPPTPLNPQRQRLKTGARQSVQRFWMRFTTMTAQRSIGLFLFLGALGPPLTLLTLDLIRDGQSAATPRYLMPMHLAVLIAVAYVVSDRLFHRPFQKPFALVTPPGTGRQPKSSARALCIWSVLTAALLSISLLSCLIGVTHTSDYQKSRNLSNPTIIKLINQTPAPLVITEADNIQDVISLSYGLNSDVRFSILPSQANLGRWLSDLRVSQHPILFFNPSDEMQQQVQDQQLGMLTPVYEPAKLIASELGLTLWALESNPQ